jgi:hypothetical protein
VKGISRSLLTDVQDWCELLDGLDVMSMVDAAQWEAGWPTSVTFGNGVRRKIARSAPGTCAP